MAVVASGDTGPRAVPLRRPRALGPASSSRDLGGHAAPRASGRRQAGTERRGGVAGRDESGQDARSGQESGRTLPGCRPGEAREGASPGNLDGGGPGTCLECTGPWGPQHCPQGPPFHSRAHLHAAHALPCPAGFRQYGPGPHRPRETNSPPARFRLPGDPSSGSSPSFCRKMTPWQPNLSLYTLQGPQHLSACV